jgi:hypothetical protein
MACGARQEYRAGDPEVFPYGAGTIRAVRGADLLEREAELRVLVRQRQFVIFGVTGISGTATA